MTSGETSAAAYLRRGLLRAGAKTVLDAVDSLNLQGHDRVSPVVGYPLRSLRQRRDVAAFCASAPLAAVSALVEILALSPLERVVAELGDHSETPTFEQLEEAIARVRADGMTDEQIVLVLTFAVGEAFPAAAHCRRLLEDDDLLSLPVLETPLPLASLLVPKEVDEDLRERRRLRRAQKKKRPATPAHPARTTQTKKVTPNTSTPALMLGGPSLAQTDGVTSRRRMNLTPVEQARFSDQHPSAGTVVLVTVPFDAVDPRAPDQREKLRPALVIAASDAGLLVRGVYSNPSPSRVLFQPWRRLNFDHVSYLDDARVALEGQSIGTLERLGELSTDEWNALA